MAKEVRLPQFGMTMESAEVVKWLHAEGAFITKGEPLMELQNDKAVMPFVSPESGFLRILASEGEEYPVGTLLAVLLISRDEEYTVPEDRA
jgi:pyruvate/2-oxoglutarate dehydrogenase complex dihydrolipoamide acyltransferase (E2) component